MSDTNKVLYEINNRVGYITLNNAAHANTLDDEIQIAMIGHLRSAQFDDNVRAVVIRAEGRMFSGGGDLDGLKELTDDIDAHSARIDECLIYPGEVAKTIRSVGKPVVGALQGAVAGAAANIMLACDFRIVSEDMFLMEAFVNVGLCTDGGGAYFLSRLIGAAKATELVMLGKPLKAQDALALGLVNKVVPVDTLREETAKFAEKLAKGPGKSYQYLKQLINQAAYGDIDTALATEVEYQRICLRSRDAKEGISAFLEKRKPEYTGR